MWHRLLPQTVRESLNAYGISDAVIDRFRLGWNGNVITAPIDNESGDVTHTARLLLKDLQSHEASTQLYGWETLRRKPWRLIVCGSIGDRLLLESRGFPAVALLGIGPVQRKLQSAVASAAGEIHVCSDLHQRVRWLLERDNAAVISLPEATQPGRRFFDLFVCLGYTAQDLERLLVSSRNLAPRKLAGNATRAARVARQIRIEDVIGHYVQLEPEGNDLVGRCLLHNGEHLSLHVFVDAQTFHCFECDADGDAVAFLMELKGLTEGQAVEKLEAMLYDDDAAA